MQEAPTWFIAVCAFVAVVILVLKVIDMAQPRDGQ